MKLFDDELVNIAKKFKDATDETLLNFWHFVFDKRHFAYRVSIENYFKKLPPESQLKIKKQIENDPNGFYQTINEIMVGGILADCGWSLTYEPSIERKTPDWLCSYGEHRLIADVLTLSTPVYIAKQSQVHSKIEELLDSIAVNAFLWLEIKNPYISDFTLSTIPEQVSEWLSQSPSKGDRLSVDGIDFVYSPSKSNSGILLSASIDDSKRGDYRGLPDKVIEKAIKYEQICNKQKLPFITILVLDRMLLSPTNVELVLCTSGASYVETRHYVDSEGTPFTKKYIPNGQGGLVEIEDRYDEGVFRKDALSGILTIYVDSRCVDTITLLKNPKATFSVPEAMALSIEDTFNKASSTQ